MIEVPDPLPVTLPKKVKKGTTPLNGEMPIGTPIGTVLQTWADGNVRYLIRADGDKNVPADGRVLRTKQFPKLSEVLGPVYEEGDGFFAVPNYQDWQSKVMRR